MHAFITLNSHLLFFRFDITLVATTDTSFDAWIGAVIRNNFLYATEQICLPDSDMTLFGLCKEFPLLNDHPLYKELKDGFPSAYYLFIHNLHAVELTHLKAGESLTFSLVLMGEISKYTAFFIDAIVFMCRKGIGVNSKAFELKEVREVSVLGENQLIYHHGELVSNQLLYPVTFDGVNTSLPSMQNDHIRLVFESPVCLVKTGRRQEVAGYQEKSNLFPGFYQLVRTAAYRLEKLHAMYATPGDTERYIESHACIEEFIEKAAWLETEQANIRKVCLQSSRRKNHNENRIPLAGYMGELVFGGNYKPYLLLLKYMEWLGVGHDLTYGFGKYRIEM